MLRLRPSAPTERVRRSAKGRVYPPLEVKRPEQAVATNDATIRLKFIILKLVAKCFIP